jgi:hypothetical protein
MITGISMTRKAEFNTHAAGYDAGMNNKLNALPGDFVAAEVRAGIARHNQVFNTDTHRGFGELGPLADSIPRNICAYLCSSVCICVKISCFICQIFAAQAE